jgi:glycosyltransferase involved in cell wall biosynthesis
MKHLLPIKIVYVISSLSTGGAEIMLLRLLERIDRTEFSPSVICLSDTGEIGSRISALGVHVESLGMLQTRSNVIPFIRLVKHMREIRPDVVHTWMYHADLMGGLAAKFAEATTLIWSVRSADFLNKHTSWTTKLLLTLCARVSGWLPDVILYNSEKGVAFHQACGYSARNNVVITNGVDLKEFTPNRQARLAIREELGLASDTPLIGLIGRFDRLKNHAGFIQAAGYLHKMIPNVHFLMAGPRVDWRNRELVQRVHEYKLSMHCHLLGSRKDIARITAALDVASLTSSSEAFPNVLIEALACGIPCVSTNAGDASLILGDDSWIVPIGDMKALATKWAKLLRLGDIEKSIFAERARQRAIDKYDISLAVLRYEAVYRDNLLRKRTFK